MGKPYSLDLRERICAYVAKGNSARSAGRLFGVSAATAVRFAAEHRDHGTALAKPQGIQFTVFMNEHGEEELAAARMREIFDGA